MVIAAAVLRLEGPQSMAAVIAQKLRFVPYTELPQTLLVDLEVRDTVTAFRGKSVFESDDRRLVELLTDSSRVMALWMRGRTMIIVMEGMSSNSNSNSSSANNKNAKI